MLETVLVAPKTISFISSLLCICTLCPIFSRGSSPSGWPLEKTCELPGSCSGARPANFPTAKQPGSNPTGRSVAVGLFRFGVATSC